MWAPEGKGGHIADPLPTPPTLGVAPVDNLRPLVGTWAGHGHRDGRNGVKDPGRKKKHPMYPLGQARTPLTPGMAPLDNPRSPADPMGLVDRGVGGRGPTIGHLSPIITGWAPKMVGNTRPPTDPIGMVDPIVGGLSLIIDRLLPMVEGWVPRVVEMAPETVG